MTAKPTPSRVLVTGGAGSLGTALIPLIRDQWPDAVIESLDIDENRSAMLRRRYPYVVARVGDCRHLHPSEAIDLCFHLAARKHVQFGDHPEATSVNLEGTYRVRDVVRHLCFASTDKAADPAHQYGTDKLIAENAVVSSGGHSLRLCNLWMSNGSLPAMIAQEVREGAERVRVPRGIVRHYLPLGIAARMLLDVYLDCEPGRYAVDLASCERMTMEEAAYKVGAKAVEFTDPLCVEKPVEVSVGKDERTEFSGVPGVWRVL